MKKFNFGPVKKRVESGGETASNRETAPQKRPTVSDFRDPLEEDDDDDDLIDYSSRKRKLVTLDNTDGNDGDKRQVVDKEDWEKEFDDVEGQSIGKRHVANAETSPIQNEADDEDDPLDAFMADMSDRAKQETTTGKEKACDQWRRNLLHIRRDDLEEDDNIESYVKHMRKKGVTVGKSNGAQYQRDENANSDEEVYAAAAAADLQTGYDSDDNILGFGNSVSSKKEIEPLPRVDHSEIDYLDFEKNFYEEHPDIAALTDDRVVEIRKKLNMHVSGAEVAKPCISFAHFGFEDSLLAVIRKLEFTEPSGIQKQAVPIALEGRDIIGIAKTGSGKTAAFVWPMLIHIMDQPELDRGDGPIGLILAPTRELAHQIHTEAKRFGKAYGLKTAVVYGGANKREQFLELRNGGVEILVATPGRLIDMIKMKATNLRRVTYLVLDEADRMFDLGFEPQVRSICDNIRPDRQTQTKLPSKALLFSATFQKKVERLARQVMTDPIRINIGGVGNSNEDITQSIEVLPDDTYKWDWLMSHLVPFTLEGSVIIFISRKEGVDELAKNLQNNGFECGALHGDLMQHERDKVLRDFKQNKFPALVATDVAARGLDIKSVRNVVNYDIARDIDSHVHRIGRTGRAGEKGTAYTLITSKEDRFAGELVRNLEQSSQPVPKSLMDLAMSNPRFRKSRNWRDHSEGGRGHGGRGRRGRGSWRGGCRGGSTSGDYAGNANTIPLGARNRSGIGAQPHFEPHLSSSFQEPAISSKYHTMLFKKPSTQAGGSQGLHSVAESGNVISNERRSRWDK
ncbi:hypothetical protein BZG36_02351 [Bifiguratus adelaidae]|uniref:RNA helicase n=1 Tax=Bifiguratus adelaidae TaxID=1938954 RepID=A0A261Y2L2_9FUNG|nr:hypothetical protein BZG36_02351 [Bifiguratus adelaidae]